MSNKAGLKRALIVVAIILLVALLIGGYTLGKGDQAMEAQREAPVPAPNRISVVSGATTVTLPAAVQARSGIQVAPVKQSLQGQETIAYGTVIDLQPLIDLRSRFATALADGETARAALRTSEAEYQRSQQLYKDNQNVSLKVVQAARAAYSSDQAKVALATASAANLRAAAQQQYGAKLASWAFDMNSQVFQALMMRREVLLRITLPLLDTTAPPASIQIDAGGGERVTASLIGASPQTDPSLQGRSVFYRSAAALSVGTRIEAFLPLSAPATSGVLIPETAIVWYGGQPWAYVQAEPTHFQRRRVTQQFPVQGSYFVTEGFRAGEKVVIAGSQLLLSEESRAAIQTGDGH